LCASVHGSACVSSADASLHGALTFGLRLQAARNTVFEDNSGFRFGKKMLSHLAAADFGGQSPSNAEAL